MFLHFVPVRALASCAAFVLSWSEMNSTVLAETPLVILRPMFFFSCMEWTRSPCGKYLCAFDNISIGGVLIANYFRSLRSVENEGIRRAKAMTAAYAS